MRLTEAYTGSCVECDCDLLWGPAVDGSHGKFSEVILEKQYYSSSTVKQNNPSRGQVSDVQQTTLRQQFDKR